MGHRARHINPDGSPKYTNRLADTASPYLLQHAHNPVDWWPWGDAALGHARELQKPILLSIGYATCYWCHVMERQCFEDEQIARLQNEHFVNIKLDREVRPDLDDLYMTATQIMTRSGGWPMNVFLTPPGAAGLGDPGLKPFYCGTYFPPTPMHGRASWPQLLEGIHEAWLDRRDTVLQQADELAGLVQQVVERAGEAQPLSERPIHAAAEQLMRTYDRQHGGFGGAPKFPTPCHVRFLLAYASRYERTGVRDAVLHTLDRMARGGIYDQVGGGFHRYSVDEYWLVPHFEKMLYDNAQLVTLYLQARGATTDPDTQKRYERVVRETCDYVLREMVDETGAFWSAQDAEVNGREGGNYVWTEPQVREAVGESLAEFALALYGVDRGPNFTDPHAPEAEPCNVLWMPEDLSEIEDGEARREAVNARLKAVRDQRDQPSTDDKVLAGWNGMMIEALALAGDQLGEPRYVQASERAAEAVATHLDTGSGLRRSMRGHVVDTDAFLEDHAWLAAGHVALFRATGDDSHLDRARGLAERADVSFGEPGGGYFDALSDNRVWVRPRSLSDGALPSANAVMAHVLLNLHELTGEDRFRNRAQSLLTSHALALSREGAQVAWLQAALLRSEETEPRAAVEVSLVYNPQTGHALHVDIAEGHHLYAPTLDESAVLPLEVAGDPDPMPVLPEPDRLDDGTAVYHGSIKVGLTLTTQTALRVRYQVCTKTSCLLPETVEVPVTG